MKANPLTLAFVAQALAFLGLLIVCALFLLGCSGAKTAADALLDEPYVALRITNNELGKLLNDWRAGALRKAQGEVDMRRAVECEVTDLSCREGVRKAVAQKYKERQDRYNEIRGVQARVKSLLQKADEDCSHGNDALCSPARDNALRERDEVVRGYDEVRSW